MSAAAAAPDAPARPGVASRDALRQHVEALGFPPAPRKGKGFAPSWAEADGVDIFMGRRTDGLYAVRLDLDGAAAQAALAALEERAPLARRLALQTSLGGQGRDLLFLTPRHVRSGILVVDGKKIGECMGEGSGGRAHADTPFLRGSLEELPVLTDEETAALLTAAGYRPYGTDRAELRRLGERLTAGYERYAHPAAIQRLLVERDGQLVPRIFDGDAPGQQIGRRLWRALMDQERAIDRSATYGALVQSLAHHAGPLGADRWAKVRALAEHTEAGGKAREKTYRLAKDTAVLIGKVATGAPRDGGGSFTIPFWARAGDQAAPALEPAPARPPGRPAGDKARMLTRLRRVLARLEPDAFGRLVFTLAELQTALGRSRRSVQGYLAALEEAGEITRPRQVNGNGPLFVVPLADPGGDRKSVV